MSFLWWTGTSHDKFIEHEETWSFINLDDFQTFGGWERFWYYYLWLELVTSVVLYAVDTATAVNLLVFDKFTSIKPAISLEVARFIISGAIIASFINLAFEHWRVYRITKRDSIAEAFLDLLTFRVQSAKLGKNRGSCRFLVFSELARSKKGAETIALFTFYTFQTWIRVVIVSGARQVVSGITLYSVYKAKFDHTQVGFGQTIVVFFEGVKSLAKENWQQAFILGGMLFSLLIWIFAALTLLTAALCYVFFLWHYIPRDAGGLLGYCTAKMNKKLARIIRKRHERISKEEGRKRLKAARKALKEAKANGQQKDLVSLSRQASMASTPSSPFAMDIEGYRKVSHSRSNTNSSIASSMYSYDDTKGKTPYGFI